MPSAQVRGREPSASLRAALRSETRSAHSALEATLDLLGPGLSRATYVHYLRRVGGYQAAVEDRLLASEPYRSAVVDAPERARADRAALDLEALGAESLERPPPSLLPPLETLPEQLGAAYVLEGSTLGALVLEREIAERLGLPAEALRYVSAHGSRTRERWRAFVDQLERAASSFSVDEDQDCIESATRTFQTLERWART